MATIYSIGPSASMEEASGSYISQPSKPQKTSLSETGSTTLDVANLNQRTVYEIGTQPTFPFIAVTKYTASIAMGCNTTDIKTTDSGEDTGESIVDDTDDTSGGDDTGESLVDEDGDGYASIESGGDDCDDTDASVNPEAEEVSGDGVDNDCDGEVDEWTVEDYSGSYTASDKALLRLNGTQANGGFGFSAVSVDYLDTDGSLGKDGYAELIVSASGEKSASGVSKAGNVYIVNGRTEAGTYDVTDVALAVFSGDSASAYLGYKLSKSNNDARLLVTNYPSATDYGANYIVPFESLTSDADGKIITDLDDVTAISGESGYYIGRDAVLISNDDGTYSIALGYQDATIYAYYGLLYYSDLTSASSLSGGTYDFAMTSTQIDDLTGIGVSRDSDIDGDGVKDFIISSSMADVSVGSTTQADAGRVQVQFGSDASGDYDTEDASFIVYGEDSYDYVGTASNAVDIDGDGYADLLIGGPGVDSNGAIGIYYGASTLSGSTPFSSADTKFTGETISGSKNDHANVGGSFVVNRDINNDGSPDLAWASDADKSNASSETNGTLYYNYGPLPTSGTTTTADADALFKGASNNRLGNKVFGLDDYNGNFFHDIGVMAGYNDSSTSGASTAYTGQFSVFSGVEEIE